jgi:hypothetical protein
VITRRALALLLLAGCADLSAVGDTQGSIVGGTATTGDPAVGGGLP